MSWVREWEKRNSYPTNCNPAEEVGLAGKWNLDEAAHPPDRCLSEPPELRRPPPPRLDARMLHVDAAMVSMKYHC
uniref:Uncharacterized protein n=1 Tax=Arundo donax TaxID=35708 RepID=A0A0A8Z833_ARUDO